MPLPAVVVAIETALARIVDVTLRHRADVGFRLLSISFPEDVPRRGNWTQFVIAVVERNGLVLKDVVVRVVAPQKHAVLRHAA